MNHAHGAVLCTLTDATEFLPGKPVFSTEAAEEAQALATGA